MDKHALIAGASGLVGHAAVRHFSRQLGWEVTAISRRKPAETGRAVFVPVDLLNPERCKEVFGRMSGVTHLIYAAVNESPDLVGGWLDRENMQTNLAMLRNLFEPLETAAKNLRHVILLQGTKAYGAHTGAVMPIPARERSPRHPHENFYWLQEDYIRTRQAGKQWHWTVLRPQFVAGEAIGSNLNVIAAIGAYAALRREAGLPLSFPGGNPSIQEMTDADLLARSMQWSFDEPACRNEIFNITNGDVFVWQEVWPVIADVLEMQVGPPEPCSLARELPRHATDWAALVRKHNLAAPIDLHAFVGESLALADMSLAYGIHSSRPLIVSSIKARQAGFHDCIDTEDMFRKWFRRFQELGLLPPVAHGNRPATR